jgi:hypothetical protein
MMDDRELAALLGETPAPDAGFRLAVFARAAARARRADARRRAGLRFAAFAAIGLAAPACGALGATLADAQPLLTAAGALSAAACAALALADPGAVRRALRR